MFELLSCVDHSVNIQVETRPVFMNRERYKENAAVYPEMAKRAGIEGIVWASFEVNESGEPNNARIERGIGGGADEASLAGVYESEFIPAKKNGNLLCTKIFGRFIFDLDQVENITFYLEDEITISD